MLPSKSTTKQTKIFLVLEFCKLKRNSIPPTTQAKQRRKKKVPSKLLHNSLPTSNIIDFKTTSKPNIKQSKQTITQKKINLNITLQVAKEFLILIKIYTHHNNYYNFLHSQGENHDSLSSTYLCLPFLGNLATNLIHF